MFFYYFFTIACTFFYTTFLSLVFIFLMFFNIIFYFTFFIWFVYLTPFLSQVAHLIYQNDFVLSTKKLNFFLILHVQLEYHFFLYQRFIILYFF
jgi:hypothetical protein